MNNQFPNDKISNHAQVSGIETSVLDNGLARGTRIAWVNTGTGLRYKVILDRAMDIADSFYNQYSLAWISHAGVVAPQPFSNRGTGWLKTFGGGLLTTCGLTHTGGPEKDENGERGLHGEISNIPSDIESIVQPDPANGKLEMSITGIMKQTQALGPSLELRRTISGSTGKALICIHDEVLNRGNIRAPHMLLYHCNFGWPLVDEGAGIIWNGKWKSREGEPRNKIFREGNNFRKCPAPLSEHNGAGEEAAFIDVRADASGRCECGIHNPKLGIAVALRFQKNQLPWLINWQHWARKEYVTGLEPATNPPVGQARVREEKQLIEIMPGEKKVYDLEIEVLSTDDAIRSFLNNSTIAD